MRRRSVLRVAIVVIATMAVVCGALYSAPFRSWVEGALAERASSALGRPVELRIDGLWPHSLEVALSDLRVAGPSGAPQLEIRTLRAKGRWSRLLRGRFELADLRISGMDLDLAQLSAGEPARDSRTKQDTGWLGPVVIERLAIEGSSVRFARAEAPLELVADGVEAGARWQREAGLYQGSVRTSAGRVHWRGVGEFPLALRSDFSLSKSGLTLAGIQLSGPGLEVTGDGEYKPNGASGLTGDLRWEVSLRELPVSSLADVGAAGGVRGRARLRGAGPSMTADVELESTGLEIRAIPIETVEARLTWIGNELQVKELEARIAGLEISGSGRFGSGEPSAGAVSGAASFHSDDVATLLEALNMAQLRVAGPLEGEVAIEGSAIQWSALRGRYRIGSKGLHPGSDRARTVRVEARGSFADGALEAERLEIEGPGIGASARGRWQPLGRSELAGSARIDSWPATEQWIRGSGPELALPWPEWLGEVEGALVAEFGLTAPSNRVPDWKRSNGFLNVRGKRLGWVHQPGYEASTELRLSIDRGEPRLDRWGLEAPGLRATIDGFATPEAGARYEIAVEAPDIAPTAMLLAGLMARPSAGARSPEREVWERGLGQLEGGLSLDGSVSGWRHGSRLDDLRGALDLGLRDVSLRGSPDAALTATLSSAFADGELSVERFRALAAGIEMDAVGRLGRQRADDLVVHLAAPRLAASLGGVRSSLAELGADGDALARLSYITGSLAAEARISGPWHAPDVEGNVNVGELQVAGHEMGDLATEVGSRGRRFRCAGSLGQAGRGVEFDGELELGEEGWVELGVRVEPQPVSPFAALAGWGDRISGEIAGRVQLTWPRGVGSGSLSLAEATINGLPIRRLDTEWTLDPDVFEITRGEVQAAGGVLTFAGSLVSPPRSSAIRLSGSGIRLQELAEAFELPIDISGILSLDGRVTGTLQAPRLESRLETRETRWVQTRAPDLAGDLALDREGLKIDLSARGDTASVLWVMDFTEGGLWSGELEYPVRVALDQWLAGNPLGTGSVAEGVLRGRLEMPGGRPELAVGRMRLDDARLTAAGYPLRVAGGLEAILDAQTATVLPFQLLGEGTELVVAAELARAPKLGIAARAQGRVDLRILQALSPGLRTSGLASVEVDATGAWPDFDWRGAVTVRDAAVQHLEFPAAVDRLNGRIELRPDLWSLRDLSARLGGGSLSVSGDVGMTGFRPGDFRIEIAGDEVRLGYPEGLRSQLDANLVLGRSEPGGTRLSGQVTLLRGIYDRDLDIERSILARQRGLDTAPEVGRRWTDGVTLDLGMLVPEGLWVRNDLADLETRGDLKVRGTLSQPRISGRIEALEGGRVFFREVSYYVTQGSFDYLGGSIDDPRLAMRAETSVADYDITLTVSGRLSEPIFELSSNPGLPTADIVTLLVTGSTRDQFVSGAGGLSQAQAASYLSSGLTKKLEASLRKSLGLDDLKFDPVLVEGQANPTARVTVGKSITPRLYTAYSSRLGTAQRDIYQTRFRLSERMNLVGTRDDDGSLSADLRYRSSRLQHVKGVDPSSTGAAAARPLIREIELRGHAVADESALRKLLGLRIGQGFRKPRLLEGLERVRGWYMENGRPEADTVYRVRETDDGIRLEIDIEEGREVRLRFDGVRGSRRLERQVLELWAKSLFREDIARDAAASLEDLLARDGYVSASVEGQLRAAAPGAVEATFSIEPGVRAQVTSVTLRGHSQFDEQKIREQILTRRRRFLGGRLDPSLVAEDAAAIRALYTSSGFLDAEVRSQVDLPEPGRRASVTFVIDEGPRFSLRSVRLVGNERVATSEVERAADLVAGQPYRDEVIRRARAAVEAFYDDSGYPDVQVFTEASVDREAHAADLVLTIEEGLEQRVEAIDIAGAGITRESVIRRVIEMTPGAPLSRAKMSASQYRLYRTGLFRSVVVDRAAGASEESVRVQVNLEEARNLRKEYGLGWDSEEGPRITANVTHTNLLGRRFHVGAGARWSPVDRRMQVLLRNPSLGGSRVAGLSTAFWEDEERENFEAVRTGVSLQLGREFRDGRIVASAGYDFTYLDETTTASVDAASVAANTVTRLGALRFGLARSTRDSSFWPTTGSHARAELSLFHGAVASEVEFGRLFAQWNRYSKALGDGIWSVGVRLGLADPFGAGAALPISERFFAGGETSLRGFALDSVVASGTPAGLAANLSPGESLGGNALLILNQELTAPIRDPVHGVVFYDVGNLFWRLADLDPTDLRHSAGVGLRVQSPVGPIRLEYGWKLDRRQAEAAGQAHFSLGLAF